MSTNEFTTNNQSGPPESPWFFAGLTSSFPNIEPPLSSIVRSKTKLSDPYTRSQNDLNTVQSSPCRIFQASHPGTLPLELTPDEALGTIGLKAQILVFQYRGKFHAIEHQCPHQSYPLSRGTLHDIEDFGIVLSAGITCPRHGWAFDLHTGESDRGSYKLEVYRVEVRERQVRKGEIGPGGDGDCESVAEVWVRKEQN